MSIVSIAAPKSVVPADASAGMKNAWRFALYNGLSFQIVLGSPMILYA